MNKYNDKYNDKCNDNLEWVVTLILICIAGVLLGSVFGQASEIKRLKQEAIRLGYAEHNRTNGVWQFIQK